MTDSPTGFPPQASRAKFASLMTGLRARAETARTEAVTGRMADTATGRNGAIAEVIDLGKRLADLDIRQDTIAMAQGRASASQAALDGVESQAGALLSDAVVALQTGARAARETLSEQARDMLGGVVSQLNSSFAGRGLFAGDAAGGAAVAGPGEIFDAVASVLNGAGPPPPPANAADARAAIEAEFATGFAYVGGAGEAPSAEIAPNERVAYHARADDPAIVAVLRSVATLAVALAPGTSTAMPEAERTALAEGAMADLRNAVDPLNRLRANIGSAEARIETVRVRNTAEQTSMTETYNALTGRDTLESAVRMQGIEGQLETLFQTTARFSRLSLANFLS